MVSGMTPGVMPDLACHRPRKRTIQYSEKSAIDRISRSVLDTRLRG